VRKSLLKLLGVVAALTLSTCVSAVGMGGINVASALGQPLKAEIELVAVNKAEKASLVARLASPDVYRGAGLEYPFGNKFKFQIESRANGESYIRVSSAQPINDPFVSVLVELTWASGKLLREYTFLLDPPDYVAEQPKPAEVQAVTPAVQAAPPETAAKPVEQAAPVAAARAEKPVSKPVMAAPAKPVTTEPAEKNIATGSITVHRGDTLNKIAMQNKPAEVSLERMLVALYRANTDQFDGKNMNRIKAGKILRLPDQSELMGVAQPDAAKEIRAQTADWNAYRQKLASAASAASQPQDTQQVATGKIASSVADKAPVAKESAKEVLKLSKGEAPGDTAAAGAAGKPATAQDKKNAEQEDAIAKGKSLKEEQARAASLEQNLKDMERLAQLKSEAAALAQPPAAASDPSAASVVAAASPSVAAASEVKPAPVAKPKPKPQPAVVPAPSLVDQILGEPLYLVGGAAILLGLGGLGFMLSRRKQAPAVVAGEKGEDIGARTGYLTAPVAPSPETGDFTSATAPRAEATPQPDDVDPISEADLFLNFGRDAQAEEILKEALQNTPNNHQIHLKLLGIYANRKDVNSFSAIARQLKDSGDEDAWQQAEAMGRKLEPNNPMYGGATIEDADSATMQTTVPDVMPDFILDDTAAVQDASAPEVDFDLGDTAAAVAPSPGQDSAEKTVIFSAEDAEAAQASIMDFDVTSTIPPMSAAEQPEGGEPAKAAQADDGGMEFTLDFPIEDVTGKPAPVGQPADAGLAGISLNLDDIGIPGEPAPEAKDEHWHEVATKLDLAKAYQEMGDAAGAREILEEVMREGDEGQCEAAQSMLDQLG
jgi:pilus assembly protein FimV